MEGQENMYIESNESKNLMKLNEDYLRVYYSPAYQKYINKNVRKLSIKQIWNEFYTGYFIKRISSMFRTKNFVSEGDSHSDICDIGNKKVAVYTVIIGGYDHLHNPMYKSPQCDYYLLTDNDIDTEHTYWNRIDIRNFDIPEDWSNTKKARYCKTHPEIFFKEYEYSIFLDGNFCIIADMVPMVEKLSSSFFATHLHPGNDCIYQEAKDIVALGKSEYGEVKKQISDYRMEGFPEHYGLFETNVLVRKHNDLECIHMNHYWWNEMEKYTLRDQLSLTYVLWKYGWGFDSVAILGENPRMNTRLRYLAHK